MLGNLAFKLALICVFAAATSFFASNRHSAPSPLLEATAIQTSVHELVTNPDKFADQAVKFEGFVGNRLTLLGHGGYRIIDPTSGEAVTVLTRSAPPPLNQKASVTGLWKPAFQVGAFSLNVIVQD